MNNSDDLRLRKRLSCEIGQVYTGTVYSTTKNRVFFYIKHDNDKTKAVWRIKSGKSNFFVEFKKGQNIKIRVIGLPEEDDADPLILVKPLSHHIPSRRFITSYPVGSTVNGVIKEILCKGDYCKKLLIEVGRNTFVISEYCSHARVNSRVICEVLSINRENRIKVQASVLQ